MQLKTIKFQAFDALQSSIISQEQPLGPRRRLRGDTTRDIANRQKRKLTPTEEDALVKWILDLDRRGFPPYLVDVHQIAVTLLAARDSQASPPSLGQNWASC